MNPTFTIKGIFSKKELRLKTEETEKLKIELIEVKKLIELREKINKDNNGDVEEAKTLIIMKNSGYQRKSPLEQSMPKVQKITVKKVEEEFNCNECDFQANEEHILRKHISWKHKEEKCFLCGYIAGNKVILRKHIDIKHSNRSKEI